MPLSDFLPFGLGALSQENQRPTGMLSRFQQPQNALNGMLSTPQNALIPSSFGGALPPATVNQNMLARLQNNTPDASWYREDGSKKGHGFLGMLPFHDGRTSSELSVGVNINGKQMDIPSLVPTLSPQEIMHLLRGGQMTDSIVQKAVDHARMRMGKGLSVFKGDNE